jgi:hypothetical protein
MEPAERPSSHVNRAQAMVQKSLKNLDSLLRGNDTGEHHTGFATSAMGVTKTARRLSVEIPPTLFREKEVDGIARTGGEGLSPS